MKTYLKQTLWKHIIKVSGLCTRTVQALIMSFVPFGAGGVVHFKLIRSAWQLPQRSI